jgi:ubiquinone/menaquinone biosynthesis C-methylase UbiE
LSSVYAARGNGSLVQLMTDQSSQDRIWHYYQTEHPEAFDGSAARLKYLATYVQPKSKVLNIGVGNGLFEEFAERRGGIVHALDPSEAAIAKLRDTYGSDSSFRVGHIQEIPFPAEQFDLVVVSEVLEHLDERTLEAALPELARVLSAEGMLIGTVPAREDLKTQTMKCPHCGRLFHRWGHMQSFDRGTLANILSAHFRLLNVTELQFTAWDCLNWKGKIIALMQRTLRLIGVRGSNENLFFICRKKAFATSGSRQSASCDDR